MKSLKSYFYRAGARWNWVDLNQELGDAASEGQVEKIKALLGAGADVHAERDGAVARAVMQGHTEAVKILLSAGAYVGAERPTWRHKLLIRRRGAGAFACEPGVSRLLTRAASTSCWRHIGSGPIYAKH
jgi:hypothetical protein